MSRIKLSRRQALAATAAMIVAPSPGFAQAQEWPKAKPIRVIVPFGAGSSTDIMARLVLDVVSRNLGQTIVVENRAGASGTLGAGAVAKSEADGYTLLVQTSSHTLTPTTFPNAGYSAENDFLAVIPVATVPSVVVVNPSRGYKTLKDLIEAAKAKPGSFNYASAGAGSATHLTAERLKLAAKLDMVHVPFKGSAEALNEVIGNRIDFYCSPVNAAIGLIREGRVTALAVSSQNRSSALPDLPTTVEAGYPNSGYEFWIGAFLPRNTPVAIRDRFHAEFVKALDDDSVKKKFGELGADALKLSPAAFEAMVKKEVAENAVTVKAAGIQVN